MKENSIMVTYGWPSQGKFPYHKYYEINGESVLIFPKGTWKRTVKSFSKTHFGVPFAELEVIEFYDKPQDQQQIRVFKKGTTIKTTLTFPSFESDEPVLRKVKKPIASIKATRSDNKGNGNSFTINFPDNPEEMPGDNNKKAVTAG